MISSLSDGLWYLVRSSVVCASVCASFEPLSPFSLRVEDPPLRDRAVAELGGVVAICRQRHRQSFPTSPVHLPPCSRLSRQRPALPEGLARPRLPRGMMAENIEARLGACLAASPTHHEGVTLCDGSRFYLARFAPGTTFPAQVLCPLDCCLATPTIRQCPQALCTYLALTRGLTLSISNAATDAARQILV